MEHLNTLHSLCEVLGVDFKQTVHEVHPSLGETDGSKNLSNSTIESLASAVNRLRELKVQRMQKVSTLYITSEISIIQRSQPYFFYYPEHSLVSNFDRSAQATLNNFQ
jgi:hypothetical protein